jgi:hypothetical protein
MSKHTPGPWTVDPEGEHAVEVEGATGAIVCTVYQPANDAPDARLIAAAPELFKILNELIADQHILVDGCARCEELHDKAKAVIAAAIGGDE